MRFRYNGRRYKVNLFPMVVALALVIAIVSIIAASCSKKEAPPGETGSGASSSAASGSSDVSSAAAQTGGEPDSGGDGILVGGSSEETPSSGGESQAASSGEASSGASSGAAAADLPAGGLSDWNLILLNPEDANKIDQDLNIEKTKFDTQYVDSRAAPAYKEMSAAAADAGITLYLRSGFRSMATQKANYEANVQRELDRGNNEAEAIRLTNLYYTIPGHSEHHTGLAFDIITPEYHRDVYDLNEKFADTDAYAWLANNCADFGFILRYPADKYNITHINFEPWHYRYVGVEHARYIMKNNLCLEEYIALLEAAGR